MALMTQTSGFTRFHVGEFARNFKVDARATWAGSQIKDGLLAQLRENAERLGKVSLNGARVTLLCLDASKVFVWKIKLAKDGDTYERISERAQDGTEEVTRGSVSLLRKAYGAANVAITDEAGAKKVCAAKKADKGTLAFYGLAHLAKEEKAKDAKKSATKGKDNGKGATKGANVVKAKESAKAKVVRVTVAKAK